MTKFFFYSNYCIYHELIGLEVEIEDLLDSTYHNVSGIIVNETKNMFEIKTLKNKLKKIPKNGLIFIFKIPSTLTNRKDTFMRVNGSILISSPQNRTKNLKRISGE